MDDNETDETISAQNVNHRKNKNESPGKAIFMADFNFLF